MFSLNSKCRKELRRARVPETLSRYPDFHNDVSSSGYCFCSALTASTSPNCGEPGVCRGHYQGGLSLSHHRIYLGVS
ncbi:hypothetical protein COCCADRAFT_99707 [Bipolaris zeicola 26-R-13]|uniref:Uncharacterized protein n=1 Tax=Cochliobolus carbonum (strain 26-R-13) TaxID=930089 RepID=W6XX54_COCC2|nr:uncharacterized protein COCCADRAFT_99707 [Bipolaris zeicola 26-R-13]EUC32057.1 hypothetical protein COCCADRAFT_99707 [Bipolaris zeicola 26-R-13]